MSASWTVPPRVLRTEGATWSATDRKARPPQHRAERAVSGSRSSAVGARGPHGLDPQTGSSQAEGRGVALALGRASPWGDEDPQCSSSCLGCYFSGPSVPHAPGLGTKRGSDTTDAWLRTGRALHSTGDPGPRATCSDGGGRWGCAEEHVPQMPQSAGGWAGGVRAPGWGWLRALGRPVHPVSPPQPVRNVPAVKGVGG